MFVDAKILNAHLPPSGRGPAFVGYKVEDTSEHKERPSNASESDDAEIDAIIFAIEDLQAIYPSMTIICDHQSVVTEATRKEVKRPSSRLVDLRNKLPSDGSIELEALQSNPAHATLTEYVNRVMKSSNDSPSENTSSQR